MVFIQRNLHQFLDGILLALPDGFRNFNGLPKANAHMPVPIPYNDESREAHIASALYDLRNSFDRNDLFFKLHSRRVD